MTAISKLSELVVTNYYLKFVFNILIVILVDGGHLEIFKI